MKRYAFYLFFVFLLMASSSNGQDFVYQPTNPAFGGNYMNHSWMLQNADKQNPYEEKSESSRFERDPLADFESSMNRQILSQLSRDLMRNYFGEGLSEGQYTVGDYEIEVAPGAEGLEVEIFDVSTGDKTTVTVPFM
ncbi:MAG: curli production assembly/transport component CsgF [Marinilabiliaceae bacterium]